jgi:hypothetical protein
MTTPAEKQTKLVAKLEHSYSLLGHFSQVIIPGHKHYILHPLTNQDFISKKLCK